jgi:shikimate dehydrogenase
MLFGLIGKSLDHSFSPSFFREHFKQLGLSQSHVYKLFELDNIEEVSRLLSRPKLCGLNVTVPYKTDIIPYLDLLDEEAAKIQAVNTILRLPDGRMKGFNTDLIGIEATIKKLFPDSEPNSAIVLGDGGASKAVQFVLDKKNIPFQVLSRKGKWRFDDFSEKDLTDNSLIIQCTPLGMFPDEDSLPPFPYKSLNQSHTLFDLVYNPPITAFLKKGLDQQCRVENGQFMLEQQALASWKIWQKAS